MICRSCRRSPVLVSVVIPADLSYTGKVRRKTVPIDACIANVVRRLNSDVDEPTTRSSCCGHELGNPEVVLADHTTIIIKD